MGFFLKISFQNHAINVSSEQMSCTFLCDFSIPLGGQSKFAQIMYENSMYGMLFNALQIKCQLASFNGYLFVVMHYLLNIKLFQ